MIDKLPNTVPHQSFGGAMIYILLAIGMLAILTGVLSEGGNQQAQTQNGTKLISEVESQISYINSALQECILNYPDQDSELSPYQNNRGYPIDPMSNYFSIQNATPGPASSTEIKNIRCPGNPGGNGPDNQNHVLIFSGGTGKFSPVVPKPFGPWYYLNGPDGVFYISWTSSNDDYIRSGLQKLASKYSICEADYIDTTSGAVQISSDGAALPANVRAFRYWVLRKPTSIPAKAGCN